VMGGSSKLSFLQDVMAVTDVKTTKANKILNIFVLIIDIFSFYY
jgi:hypothetical protein